MTKIFFAKIVAAAASISIAAAPVIADTANQLTSLNGRGAADAEDALQSRGFNFISSHVGSGGYTNSYWWDSRDRDCVMVEGYRGEVETITDAAASDCGQSRDSDDSNNDAAAAVGVIAGAAILGAILSHKSHHHDEGQHYDNNDRESDFERGYSDGLHNAAYHNYDRSDSYAEGYSSGVDQRNANVSHHHNRGGYTQIADFKDLKNARAAGATEELGRRGFRQVDNFTSGDTRYGIYWRQASRQCLQVTIADGRIYDVADIGQHPNCR